MVFSETKKTQDKRKKIKDKGEKIEDNIYTSVIDYLNAKAGTKYRANAAKTRACIHARLAEGYTLDDCKTVIDKKCAEWLGTSMEQYLRPETLFGTKFEGYLNQKGGQNNHVASVVVPAARIAERFNI